MPQLELTLPDGSSLNINDGATFGDAVAEIGEGLRRSALAARLDQTNYSLADKVPASGNLQIITRNSPEGLETLRHSTAHLLAWAVQELHPGTRFAFGPSIENGFYYDFDRGEPFTTEELVGIEAKMLELAGRKEAIIRQEIAPAEGREIFADQPYKLEQIASLGDETLSTYRMGEFVDLCEGPHVPDTTSLKAFKLLNVAGAYWRGDSSKPMLQRIYGTVFWKKKDLDEHLQMLEEAKKRDHRKLGRELDLFGIMDEAGPGLSFWFPRGDILRTQVTEYLLGVLRKGGYETVTTPHISQASLSIKLV